MKLNSIQFIDGNEWKRVSDLDFVIHIDGEDLAFRIMFRDNEWKVLFGDGENIENYIPDYVEIAKKVECEFKENYGFLLDGII